jgi:probable O-glycosylation ligase (exosortase A-associated)
MLTYIGTNLLAQTQAVAPNVGWRTIDLLLPPIVASLLAIRLVDTRQRLVLTLAVLAGSLALHAAKSGLVFLLTGGGLRVNVGIGGSMLDNNAFGYAAMRCALILAAVAQVIKEPRLKAAAWTMAGLSVLTVIATFSRSAFLALAAGVGIWIVLQGHIKRAAMAVVVAVVIGFILAPESYIERINSISEYRQDGSAVSRLHFWQVAVRMAKAKPFGVGPGQYTRAYDRYDNSFGRFGTERAAHSIHFQVLAESGWIGFAIWESLLLGSMLLTFLIRQRALSWKDRPEDRHFYRSLADGLLASQVAFYVGGSFASQALSELTWFTFAMVAATDRLSRQEMTAPADAKSTQGALTPAVRMPQSARAWPSPAPRVARRTSEVPPAMR